MKVERFASSEGNVWKYVFHFSNAIAEAVLYKYPSFEKRTVICISVQSGCPVGCTFCGTGNSFVRNLTAHEILFQPHHVMNDMNINAEDVEKFQIMFMSMGEPFLNYKNVSEAISSLHCIYPNAQLLVSTIAPRRYKKLNDFLKLSRNISNIGLQFSVHKSSDNERDKLIPYSAKLSLLEIRDYGLMWWKVTGRSPFINYCVDGTNDRKEDFDRLQLLFPVGIFNFTFSVVCSSDETMKEVSFRNLDRIREFQEFFTNAGYNTRTFDPAGQDDIGGGCGQLWYVQRFLKEMS